jgi:hypothetical protein
MASGMNYCFNLFVVGWTLGEGLSYTGYRRDQYLSFSFIPSGFVCSWLFYPEGCDFLFLFDFALAWFAH